MTNAVDVLYRYARPSRGEVAPGTTTLDLATTDAATFLDAHAERADVVAAGLVTVGDLPGTRFYVPPGSPQRRQWSDPIVTADVHALRFESLSACCGVAARLDVLPSGLDVRTVRHGTTNVDINPELRRLLTRVRTGDPMHLSVADDGLDVRTLDGHVHERKVALPERWVRSLAELQVLLAQLAPVAELDARGAAHVPAVVAPEHAVAIGVLGAAGARRAPARGSSATPASVAVGGPERLRVLEGVLRHATGLRVYGLGGDAAATSCWVVDLPHARLSVSLSAQTVRGFSGEGALLDDLVDADPAALEAAHGRLGYDVTERRYFDRVLPFGRDLLKDHPRWTRAQRLVLDGAVTPDGPDHLVRTGDGQHLVRRGAGRHRALHVHLVRDARHRPGPCAHVLAVRLAGGPSVADARGGSCRRPSGRCRRRPRAHAGQGTADALWRAVLAGDEAAVVDVVAQLPARDATHGKRPA